MRGLPFTCREGDIFEFFHPLKPINIEFLRGRDTRPSGECQVDFGSEEELEEAMTYDKRFIGQRYIELFLLNGGSGGGGGGVGGGGGMPNSVMKPAGKIANRVRQGSGSNSGSPAPSSTTGIPSLFATQQVPAVPSGGGSMTTAYPHQVAAAAAFSNNVGDMFMADMAKKMFQSAFAQYPNQMGFNGPPQQQHFGGGGGNKFNNRRY